MKLRSEQVIYELIYNSIPIINGVEFLEEKINQVVNNNEILLCTSHSIYRSPIGSNNESQFTIENQISYIPDWYLNEMFRDIVELQIYPGIKLERMFYRNIEIDKGFIITDEMKYIHLSSNDLNLLYGKKSKIYYLLVNGNRDFLPEDYKVIYSEINSCFTNALKLNIFPRITPNHIIKSRYLYQIENGQYMCKYDVPKDIFIGSHLDLNFEYYYLEHLFIFLLLLSFQPTYEFILKELKIEMQRNEDIFRIIIAYSTGNLIDFLRVREASQMLHTETKLNLKLFTNENNFDNNYLTLSFEDKINEIKYYIQSDFEKISLPNHNLISDFTSENRDYINNFYPSLLQKLKVVETKNSDIDYHSL